MPKYLLAYTSSRAATGQEMMQPTPEQQQAILAAWTAWFTNLGEHLVDPGNPTGASVTLSQSGRSDGAATGLTGYSLIQADNMDQASALAKDCPAISDGDIHLYETFEIKM